MGRYSIKKVLVVDASALMRKMISEIIDSNDEMHVIGTAKTGEEALQKAKELEPDKCSERLTQAQIRVGWRRKRQNPAEYRDIRRSHPVYDANERANHPSHRGHG